MSYDESDAAYDDWISKLYEEHKAQAIDEFTSERLQSFYLANPNVAEGAKRALREALQLRLSGYHAPAVVFAHISTETCLKMAVLRPFVYGLVHSASTAEFVTELVLVRSGLDKFKTLLFRLVKDYGGIELSELRRHGASETLWAEMNRVQRVRNDVTHRAENAESADAELAINVARAFLDDVFPRVIRGLGLHLHDGTRVCADWVCQYEGRFSPALIERIRGGG